MDKHPIGDLMETTMQKIREMVDANTIVGSPITTADGITLIRSRKSALGLPAAGPTSRKNSSRRGKTAISAAEAAPASISSRSRF
jgi:uncharacterized spore protein YtfJ